MLLIKKGQVVEDTWLMLADDAALPAQGDVVFSWQRWQAEKALLQAHSGNLGIQLENTFVISELVTDLAYFSLIVLHFPTFRDGRAYSQARQLRTYHGYVGELRATGDVLYDQLLFMQRSGFDAFQVRADQDLALCLRAFGEISVNYQKHFYSAIE